ncbi:hypothetical protein EV215_1801 [Hypnocyclicus thermotrophus]|uniref:Uncharacterized protein n=2 Tax=Hypnocyclicus thermotrophus TaxID=1627895 RepID=A0AA46DXG1_9FUSO|nr:hypothetical protein EV215_1801 [Hypnocyclicus thermotrophus]
MHFGVMILDYKCIKCGSEKYIVKTVFLPEKEPGIKLELGKYYFKTCIQCGFTEVYNAKIIDDNKQLTPKFL